MNILGTAGASSFDIVLERPAEAFNRGTDAFTAHAFNCLGSAGTAGTFGSATGCLGTAGTLGTFGSAGCEVQN